MTHQQHHFPTKMILSETQTDIPMSYRHILRATLSICRRCWMWSFVILMTNFFTRRCWIWATHHNKLWGSEAVNGIRWRHRQWQRRWQRSHRRWWICQRDQRRIWSSTRSSCRCQWRLGRLRSSGAQRLGPKLCCRPCRRSGRL